MDDYARIVRDTHGHDDYPVPPNPSQPTQPAPIQRAKLTNTPALKTTVKAIQDIVSKLARIAHSQVLSSAGTDDAEWIIFSIQLARTISNAQTKAIYPATTDLAEMRFSDQPELRTQRHEDASQEIVPAPFHHHVPQNTHQPEEAPMKAITLHQPWASLIACNAKLIETRSWQPSKDLIGQRIAIHASKQIVQISDHMHPNYNIAVRAHLGTDWPSKLPTGAIVAIATLTKTRQITNATNLPTGDELLFGEYGYLRWMWFLSNVQVIEPPIATRGYQGLWNWDPPTDISTDQPIPTATPTPKLL